MKSLYTVISILLLWSIYACKSAEQTCISMETAYIDSTIVPKSAVVNDQLKLTVFYEVHNGCGKYQSQELVQNQNSYSFDVKVKYEGCQCTMIASSQKIYFDFTPKMPGTYLFVHKGSDFISKTDTLIVK